jgi:hypothetical protein
VDWIASVRKDVECFFGILKGRWRYFKTPSTTQTHGSVDYAMRVACIINNIILRHDGLDRLWELDVNWETLNPRPEMEVDAVKGPDEVFVVDPFIPVFRENGHTHTVC